jgi:hypothetical protein
MNTELPHAVLVPAQSAALQQPPALDGVGDTYSRETASEARPHVQTPTGVSSSFTWAGQLGKDCPALFLGAA